MKTRISTAKLFAQAKVGLGATRSCGSDCYGYFITDVDPKTKTIGLYQPKSWFEKSWTDGHMKHDPFDPKAKAEFRLQAFRGRWYSYNSATKHRVAPYNIAVGHCNFYQSPSF